VRPDVDSTKAITEIAVRENDDVAQMILDHAEAGPADMILMASRGEGALAGLLFGSAVLEVTRRSPIPVLLVPIGN